MIFDTIERLGNYSIKGTKVMLDFLQNTDLDTLEPGKHALADGCYVNYSCYNTRQDIALEAHRQYIDVQVLLSGWEQVHFAPIEAGTPDTEYNPDKDVQFFRCPSQKMTSVLLEGGQFMALFPADLHGPNLAPDAHPNRKLIFKIPVE